MQTTPNPVDLPPLPESFTPEQSEFTATSTSYPSPQPALVPPVLPKEKIEEAPPLTANEKQDKRFIILLVGIVVFAAIAVGILLFLLSRVA